MYKHKEIEKKWQKFWEENKTFKVANPGDKDFDETKPKYYTLDMFPYPSGAGLHVGHPEGMTANDIVARYKHAKGYNVLHPMGWDAFGLPAENYAIKTGTHPRVTTDANISNFRKQIKSLGFSYDWDREVDTTDPEYYKWTQWIFLKLFEKGLAYEQDLPINYCPSCKTGLANEEVLNDFSCERCGETVEKKKIRQWVLAITKYADRLLKDVDKLDWPEGIKEMQRNWIGKSEGCEFEMKLAEKKTQKNEDYLPVKGDLNGRAKSSSTSSIFQTTIKVKKKNKKRLNTINGLIKNSIGNIVFNGKNIEKHFNGKTNNEIHSRKKLAGLVYDSISDINFIDNKIGYVIYKNLFIKVILGEQSNGNYFVKTYYVDDRKTKEYQEYLKTKEKNTPSIRVYTTRIDTVFGMTYAVLAPDHKDVENFITPEQRQACEKYIEEASKKSDQDRTQDDKEKTGVFTGSYVINPFNGKEVPLWIADYVLGNYGTGAVMAVPAHDTRDFEFAKKYNLEIRQSIAFIDNGVKEEKPRKGLEVIKRDVVDIIVENEKGEFLLQTETPGGVTLTHFVGGGIEKGDTELETVSKELIEETGYTDFEIIGPIKLSYAGGLFFRLTKQKNVDVLGRCFYVKLKSDKQQKSEIDEGKHTISWVKKEEVAKKLCWDAHKKFWDLFVNGEKPFTDLGILVNSGEFTGLESKEAQIKLIEFAEKEGFGEKKVNYKLRDWLFSRQRYWGEPIPLIHLEIPNVKKLPHISEEEFSEIQKEIENLINKKMKVAPLSKKEWGIHNETLAKPSLIDSIFKNTKKVKKKRKKSFKLKEFQDKITINNGQKIQFSGRYLINHFKDKQTKEFLNRIYHAQTILKNLENVNFLTDIFGVINISGKYWVVILEKLSSGDYEVITFYEFEKLNKILDKAYILKREPKDGEDVEGSICKGSGMVRELIIGGKVFSKIYDGIYGKIVCDYNLPLELPKVKKFEPAGDGQSPLAAVDSFVNVRLAENLVGKRETNTMPQWGGSCWYYLRYMDPDNKEMLVSPEAEKYWGQVDSYVGGAEHAVLHLLYARFWHKFLFDIGVVSNDEPFYRLRNQGLITAYSFQNEKGKLIANDLVEEKDGKYFDKETGEELKQVIAKMSKSLKNVVNPDEIVEQYGADTLRLYEMYMADFKDSAPWDTKNIIGVKRFLEKVERAFQPHPNPLLKGEGAGKIAEDDNEAIKLLNKTIKKVEEDIENYKFNTAIAAMMILVNYGRPKDEKLFAEWKEKFVIILSAFAPFLAEELWEKINTPLPTSPLTGERSKNSIFFAKWPEYDEKLVVDDTIKIAVQVLGKVRGTIEIAKDEDKNSVLEKARNNADVAKWIEGKDLVKEIYVPGKIVNLVVK